jgi:phosphoglycerate dehydrogenase-like enzyme
MNDELGDIGQRLKECWEATGLQITGYSPLGPASPAVASDMEYLESVRKRSLWVQV